MSSATGAARCRSVCEAGHADRAVHARYNQVLDTAHREAAEQVAALVRQAGSGS